MFYVIALREFRSSVLTGEIVLVCLYLTHFSQKMYIVCYRRTLREIVINLSRETLPMEYQSSRIKAEVDVFTDTKTDLM